MQSQNPRPVWLFAVIFCLLSGLASAQRRDATTGVAPPQPVPVSVKVRREGKTEIPLRVYGQAGEALKFLIRTPPTQGRASDPRATSRETAVTVYEPPTDLAVTADRFFYAAQSAAGVSAPVEVTITILDRPPQLAIQDALDFATVRAGASAVKLLEISNSGGGVAAGEVIVEAPWRIDGKAGYSLPAGDLAVFKIIFAPTVGGVFENVARFTSDPAHSTTLRGIGEAAIAITPMPLVLRHQPGDPVRRGTFEIVNQTDAALTLELAPNDRLKMPGQLVLAARERAAVAVETVPGDVLALQGEIVFKAADLEVRLPIKAEPPAAIVRSVLPAVMFGRVPIGRPANARFELENIGGAPGEVTWQIAAPFRTAQTSTLLLPGEKRVFTVEVESEKTGAFRTVLEYQLAGQSFAVPVEAEVAQIAAAGSLLTAVDAPRSSPQISPTDALETASEAPSAQRLRPLVMPEWFGDATPPAGVKVTAITPTTATLEWPASLSAATQFRVEFRKFALGADQRLLIAWVELAGQKVEARDGTQTTIIRDLEPAQPWVVRVLPIKPDGAPGERLFAIKFNTAPKVTLLPEVSPLRILFVALAALIAWQVAARWRRRRRV